MSFTVEDFEDLLRLLYERPEWQERLRRAIMPPELFRLPALVEELAEINRVERERVARIKPSSKRPTWSFEKASPRTASAWTASKQF